MLAGNLLVIVSDNEKQQFIAAFDKRTGKQIWRTNRDIKAGTSPAARRTGWSTPYVWTTPGRTELVTIGPGFAISYDLSGNELWRLGGMGGGPIPSPYATGGLLYLNGGTGGLLAATDGTSLIVRGNLFVNNTSPNAAAADLESNNEIDVSNNTFVGNTGSSYPITTPVGPLRCAFRPAKAVPSAARMASVFLTTRYSAFAPRGCLRNSVT